VIIVLKADVKTESPDVRSLVEFAESYPGVHTELHQIQGATRTLSELYLLGSTGVIPTEPFKEFACVERVVRITEKFRSIGRHGGALEAVGFDYNGIHMSQDTFHLFPGLCAVDTRENLEAMFRLLGEHGIQTVRAGAYKPRTSPYDFQGFGAECLPFVFEIAGKHDIRIVSMEVTHESHVDEILEALRASGNATGVMIQIGTRNAQNFELLKHVGQQTELPVLFKRGMGITLEESLNACEYVASGGNRRIVFCLRGMKTNLGDPHRNLVDFSHVPVVKRLARHIPRDRTGCDRGSQHGSRRFPPQTGRSALRWPPGSALGGAAPLYRRCEDRARSLRGAPASRRDFSDGVVAARARESAPGCSWPERKPAVGSVAVWAA
jgi:3-deoxy-7-phosphoheptulonate synthase